MTDNFDNEIVAVLGLGYVGLPIVAALSHKRRVIAFDSNKAHVQNLANGGFSPGHSNDPDQGAAADSIVWTDDELALRTSSIFIICVPTPVDHDTNPDLTYVLAASKTVARNLKKGDLVVLESTVAPGTTMGIVRETLERQSGLELDHDFVLAYCPERINPGDHKHSLATTRRIFACSSQNASQTVRRLYQDITQAPIIEVTSILVAEMSKLLENTQRDVNIALMNEVSEVCWDLQISFHDVLSAARTKWNFCDFTSGLVGGHCVAVDPYYLISVAKSSGIETPLVSLARVRNDERPVRLARVMTRLIGDANPSKNVLFLGLSFKPNVGDFRNSSALKLANTLVSFGYRVVAIDPFLAHDLDFDGDGFSSFDGAPANLDYCSVVLAVDHEQFKSSHIKAHRGTQNSLFFNVSGFARLDGLNWLDI